MLAQDMGACASVCRNGLAISANHVLCLRVADEGQPASMPPRCRLIARFKATLMLRRGLMSGLQLGVGRAR